MKRVSVVLWALFFLGCKKAEHKEANAVNRETEAEVIQSVSEKDEENLATGLPDITVPVEMGWKSVTVDSGQDVGYYNSLSHASDGGLAIAYYDAPKGDLKCAIYKEVGDVVSWEVNQVDSLGDVGLRPSLDHGPSGNPAIAYYDRTGKNLKFAAYRAGSWAIEVVDDVGDVGQFSSLQHDPQGRPAISYYDRSNADLKFAVRGEGGWVISVVDSAGRVGLHNCLRFAPGGKPVISYQDLGKDELKCATFYQDEWHSVIVDDGMDPEDPENLSKKAEVGIKGALELNADGKPAIAYFDNTNGVFKFAVYQGSLGDFKYNERPRDQWSFEIIDVVEGPGQLASLSFLPNGSPAISSNDFSEKRLFYLNRTENGWEKKRVFPAGLVDEVTSLSHGPDGRPAISCYAATDQELRLVRWTIIPKEEAD